MSMTDQTDKDLRKNPDLIFDVKVMVQPTPNPSALKFIVNKEVKATGKATFNNKEECQSNELAHSLFDVPGVSQLYFFQNVITITFSPDTNLLETEDSVIAIIKEKMLEHDPNFQIENDEDERREKLPQNVREVEEILDRTIRQGLQGDGGDVEVISLIENELAIRYQGACGSCPSSTMGTLMAIEGILRDEFDPDIQVIPV